MAKQLQILLQTVTKESDLDETIQNVWEQIKTVVNQQLVAAQQTIMNDGSEQALKNQVCFLIEYNSLMLIFTNYVFIRFFKL